MRALDLAKAARRLRTGIRPERSFPLIHSKGRSVELPYGLA